MSAFRKAIAFGASKGSGAELARQRAGSGIQVIAIARRKALLEPVALDLTDAVVPVVLALT